MAGDARRLLPIHFDSFRFLSTPVVACRGGGATGCAPSRPVLRCPRFTFGVFRAPRFPFDVRRPALDVRRSWLSALRAPCFVPRSPFSVRRPTSGVRRSAFLVVRAPRAVLRSPFSVQRSASDVLRSPFSALRAPFFVPRSPFGVRRPAFGVRRSWLSALRAPSLVAGITDHGSPMTDHRFPASPAETAGPTARAPFFVRQSSFDIQRPALSVRPTVRWAAPVCPTPPR